MKPHVLLLLLGLACCAAPAGCDLLSADRRANRQADGQTRLNVLNQSAVRFDRVRVGWLREPIEFGPVAPGASVPYRAVGQAYRYGYVEIHVGARTYVLQPIDFVGEEPLGPGRFTYALRLDGDQVDLTLQKH